MLDKNKIVTTNGVKNNQNKEYKTKTYYKLDNGDCKWYIPMVKPVEFNPRNVDIDPYLLGVLLGDGSISVMNRVGLTSKDSEIIEEIGGRLPDNILISDLKEEISFGFIMKDKNKGNNLLKSLDYYNLLGTKSENKFIPKDYKFNTTNVRLEVLQGLLDTDGYCSKNGTIQHYSVSKQLSDDVKELVQSLGGVARQRSKRGSYRLPNGELKECKICYTLTINLPEGIKPFKLTRKLNNMVDIKKYLPSRGIKNIEFSRKTLGQCITVEAEDSLYVIDQYVVTHNTLMSTIASIESGAEKVLIVCPANAKINWFREISAFIEEEEISIIKSSHWNPKRYTIINYDILKNFHTIIDGRKSYKEGEINRDLENHGFDLIILDECFTYDTKIKTDVGYLPIGEIVESNLDVKVLSYNITERKLEYKKIDRWIQKETDNTLLKIKLSNDIFIKCTPNHKIYVKNRGYVRAEEIKQDDELYYLSENTNRKTNKEETTLLFSGMCGERHREEQNYRSKSEVPLGKFEEGYTMRNLWRRRKGNTKIKTKILFNELFSKMEDVTKRYIGKNKKIFTQREEVGDIERNEQKTPTHSQIIIRENEKKQPNAQKRGGGENEKITKWSNIFKSWGEWENNKPTENSLRIIGWRRIGLGFRVPYKNKGCERQVPISTKSLLTRYRKPQTKDSGRNRWEFTQKQKMEIFRQKKNRSIEFVRVESIEILEPRCGQETTNSDRNYTKVYDLEINGNHNYFANNILVSNCHMVKNPSSNRAKIISQISKNIKRRWLLTGTPLANRPMDFYNLLKICESPVTTSWKQYAFRYCDGKKFRKKLKSGQYKDIWLTDGASNLEELHERTKNLILRRKKDDHLDLPPKIVAPYYIEIDDMTEYNNTFNEYLEWAKSEGKKLGSGRHMVELVVLRKYLALEKTKQSIALAEQAIENGKKVIIFTNFTHSFDALMKHFGRIAVGHNGKMNGTQKQFSVDEFQNNSDVKVFIGNLISAGTAITLTEAEVVIMNDLDFVPANHAQGEDRAHRLGSVTTTNVYYPIAVGTIDEYMLEVLEKKRKIINTVIGDEHEEMDIQDDLFTSIMKKYF